jgi:RNA polymerase sigma-70 factor (ECF subfamily)
MLNPLSPEIIKRATAGDTKAFRVIVEYHQGFVYAVAFRFVGNENDAEDLAQEVFVRLWKNLSSYKEEIKLTTWLYKIITNLCLDFLKSRYGKRRKNAIDIMYGHNAQDLTNPEKEFQQEELMRAIHLAAEELKPKQRAVFVLRDLEGLSPEEVSETLSMSAGNIKSNLFYARKKMNEKLRAFYQTDKLFTS